MTNDRVLVSKVLLGDMQAFRLLIQRHGRLVRNREECEELCQDVFLRVYDKIGEFNFQSRLSTWIATIAYRHAINHLRKKKIQCDSIPEDENIIQHLREIATPESLAEEHDMDCYVLKLVELLPVQYKTVLTLYHVESMNYAEIGEITGMPEGTVKNYLFRARNLLKEKVKKILGKEALL